MQRSAFCLPAAPSCRKFRTARPAAREERERAELRKLALVEHAVYRSAAGWRKHTYRNKDLLSQATPENVSLEISLSEQRGLLLVRTAIAMDFPVATGKKSHPTPAGNFTIRAKEKNYFSNLYGKIYDAQNVVIIADADARTDVVPEGRTFRGSGDALLDAPDRHGRGPSYRLRARAGPRHMDASG